MKEERKGDRERETERKLNSITQLYKVAPGRVILGKMSDDKIS